MDADDTTRRANQLWFDSGAWQRTTWMGWPVVKCPTDLWAYQELIVATRPDVIIETGSWVGGSALFFAHMLDLVGHGRVISVDVQRVDGRPEHPRITWVLGDSADPATVARVHDLAAGGAALVVLDASHRAAHVLAELRGYADLVPPGGCLVVEDTAFDGWPVW
ncbi:MAG TPA: CmcI family methyltransferase, partial [Myxococcota bacterium]|nr:CmcI family methyltransferase [Myxococcota bacterium]